MIVVGILYYVSSEKNWKLINLQSSLYVYNFKG